MMTVRYHIRQFHKILHALHDPERERLLRRNWRKIIQIALASQETGTRLQTLCLSRERTILSDTSILKLGGFKQDQDWFEHRNVTKLRDPLMLPLQQARMMHLVSTVLVKQQLQAGAARIEIGPQKSLASIRRTHAIDRYPDNLKLVHDLVRSRLIVKDIHVLEQTVLEIINNIQATPFKIVRLMNYYADVPRRHGPQYRGVHLTIALDDTHAFELQVITENGHLVGHLDHPFLVSKMRTLPDDGCRQWLEGLLWKVNLVDVENNWQDDQ